MALSVVASATAQQSGTVENLQVEGELLQIQDGVVLAVDLFPTEVFKYDPVSESADQVGSPQLDGLGYVGFAESFVIDVGREYLTGSDVNGDGDTNDSFYRATDYQTGTTSALPLTGNAPFNSIGQGSYAVLQALESISNVDLNGDGDLQDQVLQIYDHSTGNLENLGVASTGGVFLEGGKIAYSVREAGQGTGVDLDGDGDTNDLVVHVRDLATGATENLGYAGFAVGPAASGSFPRWLVLGVPEDGVDIDGDGDGNDTVPGYYDARTGQSLILPIAGAVWHTMQGDPRGDLLTIQIREDLAQADLNGDGDQLDSVVHAHRLSTGALLNTGLSGAVAATDRERIVVSVHESQQGATDFNGDGDASDQVIAVYDAASGQVTHAGREGYGADVGGGLCVAWAGQSGFVLDPSTGAVTDLGAINRAHWVAGQVFAFRVGGVWHTYDGANGVIESLGLSGFSVGYSTDGQFLFRVLEGGTGDLNGDGDTNDVIVHVFKPADADGDGIPDSAEQVLGGTNTLAVMTDSDLDVQVYDDGLGGATVAAGDFAVEFPAGTTLEAGATEVSITFDPGPGFAWVAVAGADLAGGTKSIEMPFDPDAPNPSVCIDDTPGAGSLSPQPGQCNGFRVAIPANDGDSIFDGPYTVTRVSTTPPVIRVEGLSHTLLTVDSAPVNGILGLIEAVEVLNLHNGISNSLDAKLEAAQNALFDVNQNNDQAAVNRLHAFIHAVQAQAGNHIPVPAAEALVLDAEAVIANIGS